ncbi:type II toxin-antitoxin system VapC family toxin [Pleomorphovibrio marinus]|uniref:type II toxin-antitoxin system VapC family toxin n=1 Tax=Pleomorphovibrio marinus TaxID=2164132 RepID=UPI000E0C69C0|nr:PIN domain-containing protein [Pleomorphovibrio marinus]
MENILIDAGPIIALFNKRDAYHQKAVDFIKTNPYRYYSTWPVITESSHMLDFSVKAQLNLLKWIDRGGVHLVEFSKDSLPRLIQLSEKFSDVPMDLVDASLILASEKLNILAVMSIDGDFYIYRNIRNQYLQNHFL